MTRALIALQRFLAWAGVALGLIGVLVSAWAFIDPAGMQLASASDPLGPPPDRLRSAYAFVFSLTIAAFSAHALRRRIDDDAHDERSDDRRDEHTHDDRHTRR